MKRDRLFRDNVGFRLYWSSRAVSFLGDGIATVALTLAVQARYGSGPTVGALVFAAALPHLLGPLAGTVADRVDARRLMIGCDLGQLVIYGSLAAHLPPLPALLPLVALANLLATLFRPAGTIAVPAIVGRDLLLPANAWLGLALNLQLALGPVVGAAAYGLGGIRTALVLDAASFACSALLLLRLRLPPPVAREAAAGFAHEFRAGLRYVRRNRLPRALLVTLFLFVLFAAVDNVALVFLARGPLGSGALGFGALVTAFGAGMIAAALALTRVRERLSARAVYLSGLVLCAIGTLATGISPALAPAVVAQGVAGAGNGAGNVGCETLVQQTVPPALLGRVFGTIGSAPVLGNALAALGTGFALDVLSSRALFVVGGAGAIATALLAASLIPREPDPVP